MDYNLITRSAYQEYGAVTDFKNDQGNPMPEFDALPPKIQQAWEAAVRAAIDQYGISNASKMPLSFVLTATQVKPGLYSIRAQLARSTNSNTFTRNQDVVDQAIAQVRDRSEPGKS